MKLKFPSPHRQSKHSSKRTSPLIRFPISKMARSLLSILLLFVASQTISAFPTEQSSDALPPPTYLVPSKTTRDGVQSGTIGELHWEMTFNEGIDETSDFGTNITSATALDKRSQRPDQCWQFTYGLGITLAAYKANLQQLYQGFQNEASGNYYYPPLSTVNWSVGNKKAKLTVRNQDSCYGNTVLYSTHAYYVRQIQDFCEFETGWIHRSNYADVIFIAEPNGVAPPAYSPRCNYY
ncbi:uncharacterized protein K460DRAFT_56812 [Cucurbitaria berberidis CBS 394.84]|uniref:Uncharacterized protein n=1 Tax=Cucurbitaria berberidis CBS 394.84 TaxID=1168544 RepID=A0A9P4GL36_9PLEO|nr:uncharacterized protein K460DRAFT_56812 [Cucurbitaria berberidis CBS 394.84]KAF1847321.1 hypothetical protein K460DRAFT_56812 [Cucurbitaria berberidis CBS 394.84]